MFNLLIYSFVIIYFFTNCINFENLCHFEVVFFLYGNDVSKNNIQFSEDEIEGIFKHGQLESVEFLLNHELCSEHDIKQAFISACYDNNLRLVRFLLNHEKTKPLCDINTGVTKALNADNIKIFNYLLEINPNAKISRHSHTKDIDFYKLLHAEIIPTIPKKINN